MNRSQIEAYIELRTAQRQGMYRVMQQDEQHLLINNHPYELVINYKDAFDAEMLGNRFSTILSKYDYLVGDWSYGQLRLRGFYDLDNPQYSSEQGVQTIQDYLYEDCSFGCAYFVLHNLDVQTPKKNQRTSLHRKDGNHFKRRRYAATKETRQKLRQPAFKERKHQEVKRVRTSKRKQKLVVKSKKN